MIRKGEPWGAPAERPPDLVVTGPDHALAGALLGTPGACVWFRPDRASDFAHAVGLTVADSPGPTAVPVDAMRVDGGGAEALAINMVVVGVAPDRQGWWTRTFRVSVGVDGRTLHDGPATAVVVANGEYLRGADLVPRGHPGDGRLEVQVYAVGRGERSRMRERLARGEHLPHPAIHTASARSVEISAPGPVSYDSDGVPQGPTSRLSIAVEPAIGTLLV